MRTIIEKRYLVYRKVNGKLTCEIQYGEHTTGEGIKKDTEELQRNELLDHNDYTLDIWKKIYPFKGNL